jgi:hypothetical protein
LGNTVKERCSKTSQPWPANADATQAMVEELVKRDQVATEACAGPAIRYVDRIRERDKDLQKAIK